MDKKTTNVAIVVTAVVILLALAGVALFAVTSQRSQPGGEPDAANTAPELLPTDDRTLLAYSDMTQYTPNCEEPFSNAEPTTTVHVDQPELGVSLDVPYNPDWGSDRFKIQPAELVQSASGDRPLFFGPVFVGEGCGWYRTYVLGVGPASSPEKELAKLEGQGSDVLPEEPELLTLGGHEVLKVSTLGLCNDVTYTVFGQGKTVQVSPTCGAGSDEEARLLQDVVASIAI